MRAQVFVPPACAAPAAQCNVHVFLHGCGVSLTYD
jgi:hypothetical protein